MEQSTWLDLINQPTYLMVKASPNNYSLQQINKGDNHRLSLNRTAKTGKKKKEKKSGGMLFCLCHSLTKFFFKFIFIKFLVIIQQNFLCTPQSTQSVRADSESVTFKRCITILINISSEAAFLTPVGHPESEHSTALTSESCDGSAQLLTAVPTNNARPP